jgi:hypothetical protein
VQNDSFSDEINNRYVKVAYVYRISKKIRKITFKEYVFQDINILQYYVFSFDEFIIEFSLT